MMNNLEMSRAVTASTTPTLRHQLEQELTGNILPWWMTHAVDRVNGGFYGAVTNDLQVRNDVPRSSILCARILWTFSTAYRKLGSQEYLSMARWAYEVIVSAFWDQKYGGLYWQVNSKGDPVADRKHHYAQAFAIYGLAEYYRATQDQQSLALAQTLFRLLEEHAYDAARAGYIEASSRSWRAPTIMRLSRRDLYSRKSVNTMLHILEAYTNLLRVWDDAHLKAQHKSLLEIFLLHIVNHSTGHLNLFFDDRWRSLSNNVSYGHDIEASWLLCEAAQVQGDPALLERIHEAGLALAAACYQEGLDQDGSMFYESGPQGLVEDNKEWWVQAEAMVGFYNAFQLSGREHFERAAHRCWAYAQAKLVDRQHGDWFKLLRRDGTPDVTRYKAGPWDCPYHHSRACFEMIARLDEQSQVSDGQVNFRGKGQANSRQ